MGGASRFLAQEMGISPSRSVVSSDCMSNCSGIREVGLDCGISRGPRINAGVLVLSTTCPESL